MYLCLCCFVFFGICACGVLFFLGIFDKTTPAQIHKETKQHQHKYLDRQNNTSTNT
jgi:hypothetical protein